MFVSRIIQYVSCESYFDVSCANLRDRYQFLTRDPPQFAFGEIVGNQPCDVSPHAVTNKV